MPRPIGAGELVADQPIDRVGIGNAQERLGEAHQRDALAARQREFVEEGVDAAFAVALTPRFEHEAARRRGDPRRRRLIDARPRRECARPPHSRQCDRLSRTAWRSASGTGGGEA